MYSILNRQGSWSKRKFSGFVRLEKADLPAGHRGYYECLHRLASWMPQIEKTGITSRATERPSWQSWQESYGPWASCTLRCRMPSRMKTENSEDSPHAWEDEAETCASYLHVTDARGNLGRLRHRTEAFTQTSYCLRPSSPRPRFDRND